MQNIRMKKSAFFNKHVLWFSIVLLIAAITGISIADGKWIYFGIMVAPFVIYVCIEKPFIFPVGLYCFLLPFDEVLAISGIGGGATVTKLLGVLGILVLSIKGMVGKKFKKPDYATIWWILFLLSVILTGFWAQKHTSIVPTTLTGLLILYLVTSSYQINRSEFETLKWCILLGGLVAAAYTIINNQAVVGDRVTLGTEERHATLNKFAFSILFSVSIGIQSIFKQKNIYRKGIFCVILGVILYCIVITSSRGAVLSGGVIFCMYIVFSKQKITYLSVLIIVCIALATILPVTFLDRWKDTLETGNSAGRGDIWGVGLMCLKKYWIFGAGYHNFPTVYTEFAIYAKRYVGTNRAPHNIYLSTFVELGVLGFSLFVVAQIKHYQAIRSYVSSNDSDQIMLKASFFGLLLASFFLDTIETKSFWLLWMMIMLYRNIPEEQRDYK